jgi:hypothetical protein
MDNCKEIKLPSMDIYICSRESMKIAGQAQTSEEQKQQTVSEQFETRDDQWKRGVNRWDGRDDRNRGDERDGRDGRNRRDGRDDRNIGDDRNRGNCCNQLEHLQQELRQCSTISKYYKDSINTLYQGFASKPPYREI